MANSQQPVQTVSASLTALSDRGFVHQSYSASHSGINVAASTSTAYLFLGVQAPETSLRLLAVTIWWRWKPRPPCKQQEAQ